MAEWRAMDGKTYTEREIGQFASEADARAFVEGLGAKLVKQRMSGAIYRVDRRALRITRSSYLSGFAVFETQEVTRKQ